MTKQEQINEIVKYICNVCDFKCAWFDRNGETDDCTSCPLAQETAEALYNAGYHKISDDVDNQDQIDEMAKYICNVCEMGNGFTGNCSEGGTDSYKRCTITQETAKAIYNVVHKQLPDSLQLTSDYHRYKKGFEKACKLLSRYMDFEIQEIQEKLLSMAEEEL